MIGAEELAEKLAGWAARTGGFAPGVLFLASLVEYVFPPFPGDLVVVLGAWYAVEGAISWPTAFAAVTAGALLGAAIDWRIGVALGRSVDRRLARKSPLSEERLARFEAAYRRRGAVLLAANRFLPGIRAFVFVAAGASGIPLRRVLLYGALSAIAWNALLLGAGAFVAHNAAELVRLFERYTQAAWVVLAVAALAALAVYLRRRRRRALGTPAPGEGE